jgi:hypothetical protein
MIWVLKAFILERKIWFRRHDLNINNDKSIGRGTARCGRKDKVLKSVSLMVLCL